MNTTLMNASLLNASIEDLHTHYKNKTATVEQVVTAYIEAYNQSKHLNTYTSTDFDKALFYAKELDKQGFDASKKLWGIPFSVKDIIGVLGLPNTACSSMLKNFMPLSDAFVIQQIKAAGAIILGKTNLDEFAMGSTTETSFFGVTKNPLNEELVAGGSSGGAAASVGAKHCAVALGTDTGGSIRQPAAFCGCVGLRPTYGRVARTGTIGLSSSLDQIGPLTKTVKDAAAILEVIAGHDPHDFTSAQRPVPAYTQSVDQKKNLQKLKIGLVKEFEEHTVDPVIAQNYTKAKETLKALGADFVELSMPSCLPSTSVYYIISSAEASSNLARYDGVRYGERSEKTKDLQSLYTESRDENFGQEVQQRILLGTYFLTLSNYKDYYMKAAQIRQKIVTEFAQAFTQCDCIICPTTPLLPWKPYTKTNENLNLIELDYFTIPMALAGLPSLSLPLSKGSTPTGLQLTTNAYTEELLLQIAHTFEKAWGEQ